jgi:hypothetical protein
MLVFGYDPGGKNANGVALIEQSSEPPQVWTNTVDCVDEAVDWLMAQIGSRKLDAAGIDTFLSWSTSPSGWRPMDTWLRQQYPPVLHSVFASNSAAGSMAVQGMALAMRLRAIWPELLLNETHPKVLYFGLTGQPYIFGQLLVNWLVSQMNPLAGAAISNEHEWDALISAWATIRGMSGAFMHDFMTQTQNPLLPAGPVNYYWP